MSVPTNTILTGDCLEVMKTFPDNSIDAIVSDPPYGLKFMGKDWDHGIPGEQYWEEVLRVAKPGAHLLAFGGTRTYHRLTCAIEDAGWEIRDCLMWVYGSGFPKSLDVSKAIDKAAGAEREKIQNPLAKKQTASINTIDYGDFNALEFISPLAVTEAAKQWSGWGTALKPAWEPVIMARKPIDGTVANNVLTYGTGGINIDGCRVDYLSEIDMQLSRPQGRSTSKVGALSGKSQNDRNRSEYQPNFKQGRFPANLILDETSAAMLDEQSGTLKSGKIDPDTQTPHIIKGNSLSGSIDGSLNGWVENQRCYADSGGASRFFYCAKASPSERGEGNNHPTVKPLSLMKYLCKLITPPGGLVLDPFSGSGSTLIAAKQEGFNYLGIELNPEYVEIAKARIASLPTNLSSFQ